MLTKIREVEESYRVKRTTSLSGLYSQVGACLQSVRRHGTARRRDMFHPLYHYLFISNWRSFMRAVPETTLQSQPTVSDARLGSRLTALGRKFSKYKFSTHLATSLTKPDQKKHRSQPRPTSLLSQDFGCQPLLTRGCGSAEKYFRSWIIGSLFSVGSLCCGDGIEVSEKGVHLY